MGSVGSPSAWAPYDTYRDCSQGICSIYCPQWCYIIFPPPPPLGSDDDSGTPFSPLIIVIISILATAFLLVSYYTIATRYCRRRRLRNLNLFEAHRDQVTQDQLQVVSAGLDEGLVKSITVFKYKKGDGLVEGTECAVCLNGFQENENLRLLPKCCHAFHLPCIDTWLKSHSNCPLCRANVNPAIPWSPPAAPGTQTSSTMNISSPEIQRQNDLIFVVEDQERSTHQEELFVSNVSDDFPKNPIQVDSDLENSVTRNGTLGDQEGVTQFRRSISLGTFSCRRNLLVADILRINEGHNEDLKEGNSQSETGIGSSKGIQEEQSKSNNRRREWDFVARSPAAVKRSFSTGRFTFSSHDKGKNHIIPS